MKLGRIAVGVAAVWVLASGSARAQGFDQVLSSKHNILSPAAAAQGEVVCNYCHIQAEEAKAVPLWDKRNSTKSFQVQYILSPPLGKGTPETKPFGPSFDCLTCHDGVLGNNVHQLGFSGSGPTGKPETVEVLQTGLRTPDHPDSIFYPREPDGRLTSNRADPKLKRYWSIPDRDESGVVLPTGPKSAYLNLKNVDPNDPNAVSELVRTFKGVVHCDTCHNPHNDSIRPFLRVPHKTLCLVCHDR